MNILDNIRSEIQKYFDPTNLIEGSETRSPSPSGNYAIETADYQQTKPDVNWRVTKVRITDAHSSELVAEFFVDDTHFFHAWLIKDDTEYLICAENLCGGQTVIDLVRRDISSFAPDEDGFIWARFFPSPDKNRIAIVGCHWACPYEVRVYDFTDPSVVPLSILKTVVLLEEEKDEIEWAGDYTFITHSYDGSHRSHSIL